MRDSSQNKNKNKSKPQPDLTTAGFDKLQKLLANAGLGSRRTMEQWIEQGRIKVNNKIAKIGDRVSSSDKITVDGKPLSQKGKPLSRPRVVVYNKPEGVICTRDDPQGRQTVFEALKSLSEHGRWVTVGRLDINTSGLLLLTTDGQLASRLMHPSYEVTRTYAVRVYGAVTDEMIDKLQTGVKLDDGQTSCFDSVTYEGGQGLNHWYRCSLRQGKNREVRKLWESFDVRVSRLTRVAYGLIELPRSLYVGRAEELTPDEVNALRVSVKLHPYDYPSKMHITKRRRI